MTANNSNTINGFDTATRIERARRYVECIPHPRCGTDHLCNTTLFRVVAEVVHAFAVDEADAYPIIAGWESGLGHKWRPSLDHVIRRAMRYLQQHSGSTPRGWRLTAKGTGSGQVSHAEPDADAIAEDISDLLTSYEAAESASEAIDKAYRAMLGTFSLGSADQTAILARGFTVEEIGAVGYVTLDDRIDRRKRALSAAIAEVGDEDIYRVPGVYRTLYGPEINAPSGQLIPVRDVDGRVLGLRVRVERVAKNKKGAVINGPNGKPKVEKSYLWVSGRQDHDEDARITAQVHVPVHAPEMDTATVRVTEGEYKADLATLRTGLLTLSIPGVDAWKPVLPVLDMLGARTVRIALDADHATKKGVAAALIKIAEGIAATGRPIEIETWDASDGKGIDDVIASGKVGTVRVLTGAEAQSYLDSLSDRHRLPRNGHAPVEVLQTLPQEFDEPAPSAPEPVTATPSRIEPPAVPSRLATGDETEVAMLIATHLRGLGHAVYDEGAAWVYDTAAGIYRSLPDDRLVLWVTRFSGVRVGISKPKPLKVSDAFARGAAKLVSRMLRRPGFFAGAAVGVAFENGFVRVTEKSVELVPHSAEHRARHVHRFPYVEGLVPSLFVRHLRRGIVAADERELDRYVAVIQEFAGACEAGIATRYDRAILNRGDGDDGKSQTAMVLKETAPPGSVRSVAPQVMSHEQHRARLIGAKINIVADLPEGEILDAGPLKAILTGDLISAKIVYREPIEFVPVAGHFFNINRLMKVTDRSRAFQRRWVVIEWRQVPVEDRIPNYAATLLTERQAIACWKIEGLRRLVQRGAYDVPESSQRRVEEWVGTYDSAGQFIAAEMQRIDGLTEDNFVETKAQWMRSADVYAAYRKWCTANGNQPVANNTFGKRMKEAFGAVGHDRTGNYYPAELVETIVAREAAKERELSSEDVENLVTLPGEPAVWEVRLVEREQQTVNLRVTSRDGRHAWLRLRRGDPQTSRVRVGDTFVGRAYEFDGEVRVRVSEWHEAEVA